MMKIKLIVAFGIAMLSASGQRFGGPLYFTQKMPPGAFESCRDVEASAKEFSNESPLWAYVVESFRSDQRSLFDPFLSDSGGFLWQALRWLSSYGNQGLPPRAILYSVNGRYAFRCRDNAGHFSESYGPRGDPLQFNITGGKAEIWHFSITENGMAHVFIVTDRPLDQIDGEDLMAQVKQRLGTKFSFIYVRNDPWFLGDSLDAAPYIFAPDRFRPITSEEYLNTKTLYCRTDIGCRIAPSHE